MASTPSYEGAPNNGTLILNNASSTTLSAAVLTGGTSGTRVKEIRMVTGPTTNPGSSVTVVVVRDDGSNQVVIDTVNLLNLADQVQAVLQYDNEFLASGQTLKFQARTALASGATLHIDAQGRDL
jgi:hypothetical protein